MARVLRVLIPPVLEGKAFWACFGTRQTLGASIVAVLLNVPVFGIGGAHLGLASGCGGKQSCRAPESASA